MRIHFIIFFLIIHPAFRFHAPRLIIVIPNYQRRYRELNDIYRCRLNHNPREIYTSILVQKAISKHTSFTIAHMKPKAMSPHHQVDELHIDLIFIKNVFKIPENEPKKPNSVNKEITHHIYIICKFAK